MIINLNDVDVVVPSYRHKGGHPVLISKNFANQLRIKDDHSRLDHLIGELDTNKIKYLNTDDDIILLNLNTKFEWEKYLSSFKQEKS
jgi:CTP:molybdopterin cytidylyltransferase MocA